MGHGRKISRQRLRAGAGSADGRKYLFGAGCRQQESVIRRITNGTRQESHGRRIDRRAERLHIPRCFWCTALKINSPTAEL
ncbi:hypothetical protein KCP75_00455 [Salmonella enterica subsp. enterica]|nr:hypothetical protein KCP75_00455 [Salmonella enterica subsp. enterica]